MVSRCHQQIGFNVTFNETIFFNFNFRTFTLKTIINKGIVFVIHFLVSKIEIIMAMCDVIEVNCYATWKVFIEQGLLEKTQFK